MEKLKGYRMPIFDDEIKPEQEAAAKESTLKSFYLAVFSCNNTVAYPSM